VLYNNKKKISIARRSTVKKFIHKLNFPSKRMVFIWIGVLLISCGVLIPTMGIFIGSYSYPDNAFLLTYTKLHEYISDLGALGVERYVITKYSFDILWPLIYVVFFNVLINYLRQHIKMSNYLNLIAAIAFASDMLENLYFGSYLANHGSDFIGYIGIFCYYIKWAAIFTLIAILVYKFIEFMKLKKNPISEHKEEK